ncbi:MAG: tRNA uridine-5-carboxymethylaminomethyl(34) synthesis GTPase MnmE [Treponema sp.]|jgi:tRNA modification GTPase|nr:tRNA uridine-5-carboxymethylaminomethyl(34) synthesis GTPase MnmE [Treponema sp.]
MRRYGDDDPIAAKASGGGALALIRISGRASIALLSRVFSRPRKLLDAPGNTVVYGWIVDPAEAHASRPAEAAEARRVDEVLVSVYRAPKSYTGEDGADISCHGGEASVRAVLETLKKAGFSGALAGEFSFRAFMNGKLDLTRAESVMELVSAKTGAAAERALCRLSGILEKELHGIREKLLESLSASELYLDYPEDEIDGGADGDFPGREAAEQALGRLEALAASYRRERLYREGALAAIAGRPNAGKSSLFNALLREDRSIVAEIPGTTRDWIEASVSVEGIPLRLVDTAGLRDDITNPVERIGVSRSREILETADIVVYVIDGTAGITGEDNAFLRGPHGEKSIPVWNKADAAPVKETARPGEKKITAVSAKTAAGLDGLCAVIAGSLRGSPASPDDSPGLGSERQKDLVDGAAASLREAISLADRKEPLELTAPLLREALDAVGEITGEVSTADILRAMFSRFCVGK